MGRFRIVIGSRRQYTLAAFLLSRASFNLSLDNLSRVWYFDFAMAKERWWTYKSNDKLWPTYRAVLKRANFECEVCGSPDNLIFHHIDGKGVSSVGWKGVNHKMSNIKLLCSKCHFREHQRMAGVKGSRKVGREKLVRELRDNGLTYQQIGSEVGLSRQRVHQILNPKKRVSNCLLTSHEKYGMVKKNTMVTTNRWNQKLHKEKISRAIASYRLKKEGWSEGKLMDHFGVTQTTLKRWWKVLEEEVSDNG